MFKLLHKLSSSSSGTSSSSSIASPSGLPPPYTPQAIGQLGANDSISETDEPKPTTSTLGARYLYYRIYSEEGAIVSMAPAPDVGDHYIGRILTQSIPPPRDVLSLKRCISYFEGIKEASKSTLYISPDSQSAMNDMQSVSLRGSTAPGLSPKEPVAFVVTGRSEQVELTISDGATMPTPRYLYYHVYDESHEIVSKHPANDSNPSIGRIDINRIAPPRTALSLKRYLCKLEENGTDEGSKLFSNMASKATMNDEQFFSNGKTHAGSTSQDPMVLVLSDQHPTFTKTVRAICADCDGAKNTGWLKHAKGEKFLTDGILCHVNHPAYGNRLWQAYRAQNGAGDNGYVWKAYMEFC